MSLKVLYGSQNFGYDLEDSDKDYAQIAYPTLKDIMNNQIISTTILNEDKSQIKVIDIRRLPYLLNKCNFNDLQILYSQQIENAEDFKWFFDNKERILRADLPKLYNSNAGFVLQCLNRFDLTFDYKELLRAKAFTDMLVLVTKEEEFKMVNHQLREIRRFTAPINRVEILATLDFIKDYYLNKERDTEVFNIMFEKCSDLLKAHLMEEFNHE